MSYLVKAFGSVTTGKHDDGSHGKSTIIYNYVARKDGGTKQILRCGFSCTFSLENNKKTQEYVHAMFKLKQCTGAKLHLI